MHETESARAGPVLGRVMLFMLACAVLLAAAAPLGAKLPGKWSEVGIGAVASLGTYGLTLLFVRWEKRGLADVGAAADAGSPARLAAGFLAGLALVAVWAAILAAAGHQRWARVPNAGIPAVTVALFAYLLLAGREELAFRGYPLRRLHRLLGLLGAQLVVALAFAAEHKLGGMSWIAALVGPGVGSLLFGMVAIASRGLAAPIGLHAAWNVGHWALGMKGVPGLWESVVDPGRGEGADVIGTVAYVAVFGSAAVAVWFWHRRKAAS